LFLRDQPFYKHQESNNDPSNPYTSARKQIPTIKIRCGDHNGTTIVTGIDTLCEQCYSENKVTH